MGIIAHPVCFAEDISARSIADPVNGADVVNAANGGTVININAPNGKGLSYNRYNNLQVGKEGLIFNNSYGISKTELAGWLEGNSHLANGAAKLILNEVIGDVPTCLNGFLEVAGNRAALVIANENGIAADGLGFINVSRGVLTTGRPDFAVDGNLSGFFVEKGRIEFAGQGMDSRSTPVDIMAQACSINAGILAGEMNVANGKNRILYENGIKDIERLADEHTGVLLDVSAVGGMYADKISLLGTGKGVGVNNEGIMAAKDIKILQDGSIINIGTGSIYGNKINMSAGEISNLADEFGNAALVAAADELDLKSKNVTNEEHSIFRSNGNMHIQADVLKNKSALIETAGDLDISSTEIYNANEHFASELQVSNVEHIVEYAGSGSSIRYKAGTPNLWVYNDESEHLHTPAGNYEEWCKYVYTRTTSNSVITQNDPAEIYSGGNLSLNADLVYNDKSKLSAGEELSIKTGDLQNIDFQATQKVHEQGRVESYWRHYKSGRDNTGSSSTMYNPSDKYTKYMVKTTEMIGDSMKELPDLDVENNMKSDGGIAYRRENDPRYADYGRWITSDRMINYLGLDVATLNRRLSASESAHSGLNGSDVRIDADIVHNNGNISSNGTVEIKGARIENSGLISADDIDITADGDVINNGGTISAIKDLNIKAGRDIINQASMTYNGNGSEVHNNIFAAGQIESTGKESNIKLSADRSIVVKGSSVSASGENASLSISAENIEIGTAVEKTSEHTAWSDDNYRNVSKQEDVGSHISANGNMTFVSDKDISVRGSNVVGKNINFTAGDDIEVSAGRHKSIAEEQHHHKGETGGGNSMDIRSFDNTDVDGAVVSYVVGENIAFKSGNDIKIQGNVLSKNKIDMESVGSVNITATEENLEKKHTENIRESGIFSSTKIAEKSGAKNKVLVSSSVSGGEVNISAGRDIAINASDIVADKNVDLSAGGNIDVTSGEENAASYEDYQRETSGILASGISVTIGKEKQKDKFNNISVEQKKSTVGSINGNVSIESSKDTNIVASDVLAGNSIYISGENVNIANADNSYHEDEHHEYERTGLSLGIGGTVIDTANNILNMADKAIGSKDDRLKILYGAKLYEEGKEAVDTVKNIKNISDSLSLNVSFGTAKSDSRLESNTVLAVGSNISADGDVAINARNGNIDVKGSQVNGNNVDLSASQDIKLTTASNTNVVDYEGSSSYVGVGAGFNLAGNLTNITGGVSRVEGNIKENTVSHTPTKAVAENKLHIKSGEDTDIIGSHVSGNRVEMEAGANLNIKTLQESKQYYEHGNSASMGISSANLPNGNGISKADGTASIGKTDVESDFKSVQGQAGIYAGTDGFDILVGNNTDLQGGVIASEAFADINNLNTGSLTYSDIENKAAYEASNIGAEFNSRQNLKNGSAEVKNMQGITPVIGIPAKDESSSATKSAIAAGIIEIRDNPNQDISDLSRDTGSALNRLEEIFDRQTVEEQQEMAKIFGELAYKQIHILAKKNGWSEGSPEKTALHALVGGIMSDMTGAGFISGAAGAGLNEMLQKELQKLKDPTLHQIASAVIGSVAGEIAGGNAQVGAGTAASGTRNNVLLEYIIGLDNLEKVSRLPEGYCEFLSMGIGDATETIMVFHIGDDKDNYPVFVCDSASKGVSVFPISASFGKGCLIDQNGEIVTSLSKLKEGLTEFSIDASGSGTIQNALSMGMGKDGLPSGYRFITEGIGLNGEVSAGISYTYYVGTAREVNEKLRNKPLVDIIKELILG